MQSVASYLPATETVTFGRQANYRDNQILANQTSLTGRVTTGSLSHALTAGFELISRRLLRAGPDRRRHPRQRERLLPESVRAGRRLRAGTERRDHRRQHPHDRRLGLRRREHRPAAVERRSARRKLRHGVPRPGDHRHPTPTSTPPTRIFSGKAGLLFKFSPNGNVYVVLRQHGDAAGLGQLHPERAGQQRQQPERRSAELAQLRGRHQVGPVPPAVVGRRWRCSTRGTRTSSSPSTPWPCRRSSTRTTSSTSKAATVGLVGQIDRPLERDGELRLYERPAELAERRHRPASAAR